MFNPFKPTRARARSLKRLQKKQVSVLTGLFGATVKASLPKPARKKPRKTTMAATKPKSKPKAATPAPVRKASPRGAAFRRGTHTCDQGQRAYRLYVPAAGSVGASLPLLVMLHGCGQTPEDFATGTRMNALAEEKGFIVLYPAQSSKAHLNRCWNWFRRGDQRRGMGEPALLAGMTRQVMADTGADPARIYVAGMSAGASAALILGACYPDLFAAVGAHSGLPVGSAHDKATAVMAMQQGDPGVKSPVPMPTITFHGSADHVVNPRNGRFITIRALEPAGRLQKTVRQVQVKDARDYVRTIYRVGVAGRPFAEHWAITGAGHAWSGGHPRGSYTDTAGPDASAEMVRFLLRHRTTQKRRLKVPTD